MSLSFRPADEADAEELCAIYAPYVQDTAISFEYAVPDISVFRKRIHAISQSYPYLVAVGDDGSLVGYAYAATFHAREAYRFSAEMSIYVRGDVHGRGVGKALYAEIEKRLKARRMVALYACIAASPRKDDPYLTDASIRFHEKVGYHSCGFFSHCAIKFGLRYDMVYMEKALN